MIYVIHWFVNILTLGLVSIATITTTTYHVDEPITELNNQSLNDVFDIGNVVQNYDFSNGTTNWEDMSRSSLSIVNNNLRVSSIATGSNYFFVKQSGFLGINQKYYFYFKYRVNDLTNLSFLRFVINGNNVPYQFTPTSTDWIEVSFIETDDMSNFRIDLQYTDITNKYYELNGDVGVYAINMSSLGIDNLTKNDMDDWYNIYVKAVANNGVYIESTSHLNNNIHLVDVSVMVISFGFWVWLIKFLKGVII